MKDQVRTPVGTAYLPQTNSSFAKFACDVNGPESGRRNRLQIDGVDVIRGRPLNIFGAKVYRA
jgi:hypothetical protein